MFESDPAVIEVGAHEFRNLFGLYMEKAVKDGAEIRVTRRGKPYVTMVAAQPQLSAVA